MMLLAILLFFCFDASGLPAAVIRVPQDVPSIQGGFDSISDGDTVLVAVGVYVEALTAPPLRFVLKGDVVPDSGDYPRPLIDPSTLPGSPGLACLILPEDSHPTIEDVRFRNGAEMYPRDPWGAEGGIRCWSVDPVLRRCLLDTLWVGFAQHNESPETQIKFEECEFRGDSFRCVSAPLSIVQATDCFFSGGGGFELVSMNAHSKIRYCRFQDNNQGYLLNAYGTDIEISNCVFGPRPPWMFAAVRVQMDGRIDSNLFLDCHADPAVLSVNAFLPHQAPIEVSYNMFFRNGPPGNQGQGPDEISVMWQDDGGPGPAAHIHHNVFVQCTTQIRPKGIDCFLAGALIESNRFFDLWPSEIPAVGVQTDALNPVTMTRNLFWNNGVAASGPVALDARWNWWGHESGPYHATRNPLGQGDEVQGDLLFEPWYPDTSFLNVHGIHTPLPERFELGAYPNPFNSSVTLTLVPSEAAIVWVELFDLLGRRVEEIWSGPIAYEKRIAFNSSHLASGIYFVQVWQPIGNRALAMQKLVLLK